MFRRGRGRDFVLPFISHQLLEYLAGLYLVQVGSKVGGRAATVSYVAGAAMVAAAAFSGRPLGGGRLRRGAHRFVDLALIAGVAAAPFLFDLTDQTTTVVRMEGIAVLWLAVFRFTNYTYPQVGTGRQIARGLKDNAPRLAGRVVGRRMAAKRRPPGSGPS